MTKLSEEILNAKDEQRVEQILNFVSHIDLKREYVLLAKEGAKVDNVIKELKADPPKTKSRKKRSDNP